MKTNKNFKDRSTNQMATSYVDLVSEAPQMEIFNREQSKTIAGVMAAVLDIFHSENGSILFKLF